MKLYNLGINNYVIIAVFSIASLSCQMQVDEPKVESRVETLPFYQEAFFSPEWLAPDELPSGFHKIPDFSFINQEGERITQETFKDKIYITDFFFTTCPGICPKMTTNMVLLQEEFKDVDDVLLLSHSVTPELDTVPALASYAERFGVNAEKWHLVTGSKKEIYNLGRNYYFVEEDLGLQRSEDDFLHTENFVLIDKNKHIRGIYSGLNRTSINQLIADVETLRKE